MYKEYSGGLMAELCSHQIDIVNWLLNTNPLKVQGTGGIDYWKDGRETYDNVHAVYEYPAGTKATFTSLTTNAFMGFSIKLMGTKGTIELWNEDVLKANIYFEPNNTSIKASEADASSGATSTTWVRGEAIPITVDNIEYNLGYDATSRLALEHFAQCIREHKKPASNIVNGGETTIAAHMGNMAIEKGTVEIWKPEYNLSQNPK